jgi:hypothetical protein
VKSSYATVSPIWLDGPWEGKEHKIFAWHIMNVGGFIVQWIEDEDLLISEHPLPAFTSHIQDAIYFFRQYAIFGHRIVIATIHPDLKDLEYFNDKLFELVASDKAKAAAL